MWEKDEVIWRVRWTWSETSCRQHYAEGMVPRTAEESSWSACRQWITSIYPNYTELSFKELFSQFKWINLYSGSRHSCVNLGRISQLSEDLITLVKWTQSHSYFDHTLPPSPSFILQLTKGKKNSYEKMFHIICCQRNAR